ncbi:alpha/beta hydrolase-fold protein [Halalkalibacter sp. AB-rgal2]|uniref:alpha/beta hydrolase-fold protein n=1 Tax=Halalkalibacter sp. AB-rgal2 TaxID=3242695 RepID=UPI00359D39DA
MNREKMCKQIRIFSLIMLVFFIMACSSDGENKEGTQELKPDNVTLITKVLPLGEVAYAIAIDFEEEVHSSTISEASFEVEVMKDEEMESRTISSVYTNEQAEISQMSRPGRFVIIELDTSDPNASMLTFQHEAFLHTRKELAYTVTQKEDITVSSGTIFVASTERVEPLDVKTPIVDQFGEFTYRNEVGSEMPYRLFEPTTKSNEEYPLVLFLHGSGERGTDNALQLLGNQSALVWANSEQQANNPAYVLAPQAPAHEELTAYWTEKPNDSLLEEVLEDVMEQYPIDRDRIYVTGVSNGGIGTWHIALKRPDLFAAAVPVCGIAIIANYSIGEPYTPLEDPSELEPVKDMPIWVFHAADDHLVDVRFSRDAVVALKSIGGRTIHYTEYPEGAVEPDGHFAWIPAYQNQEMIDWVFQQSK